MLNFLCFFFFFVFFFFFFFFVFLFVFFFFFFVVVVVVLFNAAKTDTFLAVHHMGLFLLLFLNQTKMLIHVNRINHFQHLTQPVQVTSITSFRYLVLTTEGEGRNIVLVRCWHPGCSLSVFCLLNQLVEFAQTCTDTLLGGRKEVKILVTLTSFSRSYQHFEIFTKKACLHPIS